MTDDSFTLSIDVDRDPLEVYHAINDVRAWWEGDIEGDTDRAGAEFTYRNDPYHRSTHRITELEPGRLVVWHVVDSHLSFVTDGAEWTGTDIVFDITPTASGSTVRFTHRGLRPALACYRDCSQGWQHFAGTALRDHLTAPSPARPRPRP